MSRSRIEPYKLYDCATTIGEVTFVSLPSSTQPCSTESDPINKSLHALAILRYISVAHVGSEGVTVEKQV